MPLYALTQFFTTAMLLSMLVVAVFAAIELICDEPEHRRGVIISITLVVLATLLCLFFVWG